MGGSSANDSESETNVTEAPNTDAPSVTPKPVMSTTEVPAAKHTTHKHSGSASGSESGSDSDDESGSSTDDSESEANVTKTSKTDASSVTDGHVTDESIHTGESSEEVHEGVPSDKPCSGCCRGCGCNGGCDKNLRAPSVMLNFKQLPSYFNMVLENKEEDGQ